MHGFARLAFWRKPAAATLDGTAPSAVPEPATARQSKRGEAEASAAADVPERQAGWFARLKQALFRRLPKPEPIKTEADIAQSNSSQPNATTPSSQAESVADADELPVSRVQRVRALLSSKRVWIPGISIMLIAIIATMTGMLLQSGQEKKHLQIELVAAQQKLKRANMVQKATLSPGAAIPAVPEQAGNPVVAAADDQPAESKSKSDIGAGECQISNPENVAENLKNCIDSFNGMAN